MTLANRLTMLRIFLALAMFLALMRATPSGHLAAFALFVLAMITDWVDGYVARATRTTSAFGKVADPVADKILVLGALIALAKTKPLELPGWAVFLIIARELLVGGIRTLAGAQGKILAAESWGKWKMGIESSAIVLILAILVATDRMAVPPFVWSLPYYLTVLCVVTTWTSAVLYIRQSRKMLQSSWG